MASHLSLKRILNRVAKKHFGELPAGTTICWKPLNGSNGECHCTDRIINIDTTLQGSNVLVELTIIHELIHLFNPTFGHGKRFRSEVRRLFEAGAYDRIL
jgi:predicted metal-dependent hydrolase